MVLYVIGAIVLELNVLSAVFYEQHAKGSNSRALLLYAGLFTWFIVDYLWYEEVHLYTYNLFAEKIGFKLLLGCLCFYPFFYPMGGVLPFTMVKIQGDESDSNITRDHLSLFSMVIISLIYTVGSFLTRGANMQNFYYRRHPHQRTVTLFEGLLVLRQQSVPSSNGRLLCSGFWGMSRHSYQLFGRNLASRCFGLAGMAAFKKQQRRRQQLGSSSIHIMAISALLCGALCSETVGR